MRLFTAVELPEATRARVASFGNELVEGLQPGELLRRREGLNAVPPENLHVTVHFLGSVPDAKAPEIVAALKNALTGRTAGTPEGTTEGTTEGTLTGTAVVRGVGAFPKRMRPRVVWAGVDDPEGTLGRLHAVVTSALAPLGYPAEERRYHPHVTLARVPQKKRPPRVLVERIGSIHENTPELELGPVSVDHLTVFRSRFARPAEDVPAADRLAAEAGGAESGETAHDGGPEGGAARGQKRRGGPLYEALVRIPLRNP